MRIKLLLVHLFKVLLLAFTVTTGASPISFTPSSLSLALGETQKIQVSGTTAGDFSIGGFDTNVAEAYLNKNTISVTGKAQGDTIIFVVDSDGTMAGCRVAVRTKKNGLQNSFALEVSGEPADSTLLAEAAKNAILQEITLEPGSVVEISKLTSEVQSIKPAQSTLLTALVSISDGNTTAEERNISIVATNIGIPYREDDYILMSNNPEVLTQAGLLFRETISRGESTRLIYHHMNEKDGPPRTLRVTLTNPGHKPAKIFTHQGLGGPTVDSLFAGHVATKRFMNQMLNKSGYILTVPPGKSITIVSHRPLKSEESATGLIKLWLLDGEQCTVEVLAIDTLQNYKKTRNIPKPELLPLDGLAGHVRGHFQPTKIAAGLVMDVSDQDKIVELGLQPSVISDDNQFKLIGNYGLLHEYQLLLTNHSNQSSKISLYCLPLGGLSRAIFVINNKIIETGVLDPHSSSKNKVFTFQLPAMSEKYITLATMPQAGSFYPVKLIFKGG